MALRSCDEYRAALHAGRVAALCLFLAGDSLAAIRLQMYVMGSVHGLSNTPRTVFYSRLWKLRGQPANHDNNIGVDITVSQSTTIGASATSELPWTVDE